MRRRPMRTQNAQTDGASAKTFGPSGYTIPFITTIADIGSISEQHLHGGILSLATGQPLDSVPTDIVVTNGRGKLLIVVNAGTDIVGTITVTGTKVDRDTGETTAGHTNTIAVDALTVDAADTDANGNARHSLTGAYITEDWFTGSVTLSTADLTLTDVDVSQISFEQVNDADAFVMRTLDLHSNATNAAAELDTYWYAIEVTGDKVDVTREASINLTGVTALRLYRDRVGGTALGKALCGRTDGFFIDLFNVSANKIDNLTLTAWVTVVGSAADVLSIATQGVSDHGELDGLGDNDHTQYYEVGGANPLTADFDLGGSVRSFVNDDGDTIIQLVGGSTVVDFLQIVAGATGSPGVVTLLAQGSDTNIDVTITPKGSGAANVDGVDVAAHDHSSGTGQTRLAAKDRRVVKMFYIETPVADDEFPQAYLEDAATFTEVFGNTDTGTITFNIERRSKFAPDAAGTDIIDSGTAQDPDLLIDATGETNGNFAASGQVAANQWLVVKITSVASTPTKGWIALVGTID